MSFINRAARLGLLFGAIFLALGVATQLLLSRAMMKDSTGRMWRTCELCGRDVAAGNGYIIAPGSLHYLHWFHPTTEVVLEPGDPACTHEWQRRSFRFFQTSAPVVYPIALIVSVVFFVMAIASTVCYFFVHCLRRPRNPSG